MYQWAFRRVPLHQTRGCILFMVGIDLESLTLDGENNLMGFDDAMDGLEHTVVCGSFSFSSATDVPGFFVSKHSVCQAHRDMLSAALAAAASHCKSRNKLQRIQFCTEFPGSRPRAGPHNR